MPLSVTEITGGSEFEALGPESSALWARCPDATPFQSPEWLIPWWRHLFNGGQLWALAMHEGQRLAALAPFFIYGHEVRRVAMLGAGITDYLDILVEPGLAGDAAARTLEHLADRRTCWDECAFDDLRPGSPLLDAPSLAGLAAEYTESSPCPVLELPLLPEDLQECLPAKFRTDLRRARNRLLRTELRFETAAPQDVPGYLNALFELHGAAWHARHQTGVLATQDLQAFHRDVAAGMQASGCLRFWALRSSGSFAAVVYGFARRGRTYAYLGGFDPALAKLSPGAALMGYAIERSIEQGMREFDFLRGREEYKYLWGAHDRLNRRLTLRHA